MKKIRCGACKRRFILGRLEYARKIKLSKSGKLFCSSRCVTIYKARAAKAKRIIKRCAWCSKEFSLQPSAYRRRMKQSKTGKLFCGYRCTSRYKTRGKRAKCDYCRKSIWLEPKQRTKYCSKACSSIASRVIVWRKCKMCGIRFKRKPAPNRPGKYCSSSCFRKFEKSKNRIVKCYQCGSLHRRKPSQIKKRMFCSIACSRLFIKEKRALTLSKKCEQCGQVFISSHKAKKKKTRFCSLKCWLRCKKSTKPEMIVRNAIRCIGAKASESKNPLAHFTYPDFVFKSEKLCIYVDGAYWHRNSQKKDKLQQKVLYAAGFSVLRIPESVVYGQGLDALLRRALLKAKAKVKSAK